MITELKENEIFVFGSNLAGIHGAGAAKAAVQWGAVFGKGEGLQGKTYAIPTKDANIQVLTLSEIQLYVRNFIEHAKLNTDNIYLVTEIGCGLAGYKPFQVAPMFKAALSLKNVKLPEAFLKILNGDSL